MKNEVNRAPNIGAKKHKFSSFLTHKGRWFLATLTLLFTLSIGQMWGASTTLFNVDFSAQTNEDITTSSSSAVWVAKTYSGYNMSMGIKSGKPIKIINDGLEFSENNFNTYTCLAIPLTGVTTEKITVTITLASSGKVKYAWASGNLPASPSVSSGTAYGTAGTTNTLEYTPASAGNYVLYLGRNGSSDGKVIKSIVISQAVSGYSITYEENGHGANQTDLTGQTALPNPLPTLSESGWTFGGWFTDNGTFENAATAGASISSNTTLYAKWTAAPASGYTITTSTANGTIAVTDGSSAITSAESGNDVYITATPETGYGFTSWDVYKTSDATTKVSLAADDDSDNKTRKFTMPAYPVTVGATFSAINYTVTHSAATNGSYTIKVGDAAAVSTNTTANYGQTVTLAANPATGYVFSGWTVLQGETPVSVTNNQFTMPDGSVTVSATFDENACPTSGVIFSANAKTTSDKNFSNGTTEITSADADITGGKVYAISGQSDSKVLLTKNGRFSMTNNNTIFKFELDCALAVGDKITIDGQGGVKSEVNKGLWVTTTEARPSSAPACSGENGTDGWYEPMLSYIVTNSDGYKDATTLYIHRQAGATQHFDNVVITRPYTISFSSAKGTAPSATTGFEVELAQITGVDGWNHTGWTANQAVEVGGETKTVGTALAVDATAVLSANTTFTATWEEVLSPAETPVITANPASADYEWNDVIAALTVTVAAVSDGGTLSYQWYKEAGETDTEVGTNAASYTPTEAGTYYVVVTNSKAGKSNSSATSANAVITVAARPSYTVTYYDGASSIGSESVLDEASPVEYAAKQAKAVYGVTGLYEFNGWYNNSDLAEAHKIANIAALSITANTPIYGKWTRVEAEDVNLVEYAATIAGDASTEEEFNAFKTWFTGKGYAYANLKELDNKAGNNGAYLGLKTKSDAAYIAFNVPANKRVTIKLGYMAAAAEMYINGVKDETQALTGGSTSSGNANYADWKYDVTEASTFKLLMKSSSTCVVKAITIGDIPAESDDATLSDLKVDGTTVDGFAASTLDYYVELPYGTEDAPTVAGTANDANAKSVTPTQAESLPGNATIVVVAEDNTTSKTYTVHFSVAPKLGVELIKATHTGEHTANKAGYWSNDVTIDKTTQGGGKLGSDDHYFGLTFSGSKKFMNGDLLCIYLDPNETESQWLQVFKDKGTNIIVDQKSNVKKGANYFTLSGLPDGGIDELYLYRKSSKMNPYVDYIAVYREMDPFFESFSVAGAAATIDETTSPKTITVEVPAVTDITALTPTYKAWANGGATVSPTTAQNFSTGAIDYTVTSAYSEATTYQVTVTKAAAIKEVVISGTLTVQEDATTTLSAVVYDTNDDEAANQNVEWSIPALEAEYATVSDAGVVTALKAGTVHVTATSEADDSKSATVEVVISENPCRTWSNPSSKETGATIGKMVVTPISIGTLQENMVPYQGATACNAWKLDSKDSRYAEIKFTDNAQFESLTLGVSSKENSKDYKFAVACSSKAGANFADGFLSAATYEAVDADEDETLVNVVLAAGTKAVRVYRQYTNDYGGGSSVFLYYVNACKKEFVPVTAVAVADGNLAIGKSLTLSATTTPVNADIASYVWTIESATATGVTIDGNVLTAAAGATEGEVVVKVVATDVLSNVVQTTATISIVNKFETVKPVTGTTTWDWAPVSVLENGPTIAAPDTVLANYISGEIWEMLAGGNGDRPYRDNSSYKCYQGKTLCFETTVPGMLIIKARRQDSGDKLYVNGSKVADLTTDQVYDTVAVAAGKVKITGAEGMRIYWMKFDANLTSYALTDNVWNGYERTVDPQYYGTICLPKAGVMTGALLFRVSYMDYKEDNVTPYKVYYDQVANGTMEAGMPYIFLAEQSTIGVYYTGTATETAQDHNGLHGTLEDITSGMNAEGRYMIYYNQVLHSTNSASQLPANRAYLQIEEIPGYGNPSYVAPAPKYRRISMGVNAPQIATGMDELNVTDAPRKIMIDGTMYILRGEKMYDATGRLVK